MREKGLLEVWRILWGLFVRASPYLRRQRQPIAAHPDRLSPTTLWDAVEAALALRGSEPARAARAPFDRLAGTR